MVHCFYTTSIAADSNLCSVKTIADMDFNSTETVVHVVFILFYFVQLNRVKTVEKEKDDLEGVKNEALEYLSLENEVVRKKNMLYQKYL